MVSKLDKAITKAAANKQEYNKRGAEDTTRNAEQPKELESNQVFSKLQQKSAVQNAGDVQLGEEERIGGAFYLPLKADLGATWTALVDALEQMEDCDINIQNDQSYIAFGLQYFRDTFMLARTKLCKLEGEQGNFLEICKLQGDGFVFADEFKKNLTSKLGDYVEDVEVVEPVESENKMNPQLNFLDLSNQDVAGEMIQLWLGALKPAGGVKYDQQRIYEAVCSLGWNCNDENNFKVLAEYSEHIGAPLLEILRHEETTFLPTAYFASMCLNKFVAGDAIEDELKTWKSVQMLVESLEKFTLSTKEAGLADLQVTQSRGVEKLISSILIKLAPMCKDEKTDQIAGKIEAVLNKLPSVSNQLREALGVKEEEEVQSS